jgi:hypothetical protein
MAAGTLVGAFNVLVLPACRGTTNCHFLPRFEESLARRPHVSSSKFFWEKNLKLLTLGHHHSGRFDRGLSLERLSGAAKRSFAGS